MRTGSRTSPRGPPHMSPFAPVPHVPRRGPHARIRRPRPARRALRPQPAVCTHLDPIAPLLLSRVSHSEKRASRMIPCKPPSADPLIPPEAGATPVILAASSFESPFGCKTESFVYSTPLPIRVSKKPCIRHLGFCKAHVLDSPNTCHDSSNRIYKTLCFATK